MGQRIGHVQQVGPRHQLLADLLLQPYEQLADALVVALDVRRFAVERAAGGDDGEREVVADVGVDAGERKTTELASQPWQPNRG
ncbi:hypothetical protein GCM10009802_41730 [Streptomyces synnematoformans]|uniref:Uncharacterized protein n=1 Tax=Streptomyces synnematoformans TaxID=415721 RepID=A0ABP5KJQ3_9ACTN